MISIVVPCYNEETTIEIFLREIKKTELLMKDKYNECFEYIFIDDGSTDKTLEVLRHSGVKYISFSRNFGKEAGLLAGLKNASGEYVAVMDVDLQDPPEMLEEMYIALQTGEFDCVATKRRTRTGEPLIRSFFAKTFYKLINMISETKLVDGARDFRLMNRKVVDAVLSMNEYNRFSKGLFSWVGFNTKWIEYDNRKRSTGVTKWSFWKLFLYSLDGVIAFSVAPLTITSVVGFLMCIVSVLGILIIVTKTLIWGDPVAGYPSLICVLFLVSGIQIFCIGVVGQYLAKLYAESKHRPIYIIKESNIGDAVQ